jgi:NAD(P)-dependent dehydrogenase (short-subunit alcohol dehydrogenase family)
MSEGLRHNGKIVIVTGAAIGNGQAIARQFGMEGANVIIADIADASETVEMTKKLDPPGTIESLITDITSEDQTKDLIAKIKSKHGKIDVLINNAGIYDEEPFDLLSFDDWKKVIDVNLNGLFLMTKAVVPLMKQSGFGRIINMSSNTIWLGTPYLVHYVTTKMGVVGFTRALASEVGKYGITVNALTVGLTATQRPAGASELHGNLLAHTMPAGSGFAAETPEDIAEIVSFLASEKSAMITGQALNVDGGVARH